MSALVHTLAQIGARSPSKTAIVDGARVVSYAALLAKIARAARFLAHEHSVRAGDRVASVMASGEDTIVLLFSCAAIGATFVPLNTRLAPTELATLVHTCRPRLVLGDTAGLGIGAGISLPPSLGEDASWPVSPSDAASESASAARSDAPAVLLFTSGSTGAPKGVCITEAQIVANARATKDAWDLSDRDVTVNAAPMFHAGGLFVLTLPLLLAGGSVVTMSRFDESAWAALSASHGATIGFGVPTMLERLARDPSFDAIAHTSRLWVSGGAPCPPSVFAAFREKGVRLVAGFGMTEVGPNCFQPVDGMDEASVGVPAAGLVATLVTDGQALDPNEDGTGELWLAGPQVAAGYFERDDETRATFVGGAVRTGDVFTRKNGLYFVTGRVKDMYISGGENVYAGEVERVLALHPAVLEAAVVGVPDATWGEVGHAFVVSRSALDEAEVRAFVRERLAAYKVPKRVFTLDALPRTASGKIAKGALPTRAPLVRPPACGTDFQPPARGTDFQGSPLVRDFPGSPLVRDFPGS